MRFQDSQDIAMVSSPDWSSLSVADSSACVNDSPAWANLVSMAGHYLHRFDLRSAFSEQPRRFEFLSLRAPHLMADLSKNLWDVSVLQQLLVLAQSAGLSERRAKLLSGGIVNDTEQRPALHAALRRAFISGGKQSKDMAAHCADLQAMLNLAQDIRSRRQITDVVHIGIGGSSLGPKLAVQALQSFQSSPQRIHFVSNMDGHDLDLALQGLIPAHTLFIVASKSWSTAETLRNAQSAFNWLGQNTGLKAEEHFVAITAQHSRAKSFGIEHVLNLPEGIGGRYSLWSAVGLPLAISIGTGAFKDFLQGAVSMDAHFEYTPLQRNLPVWLGLLDVWHSSFLYLSGHCVTPYHHGLRSLPAYLQQLVMESNGKRVRVDGSALPYPTSGAVWGAAGTNSQHAFFQFLHQGTQRIPLEIMVVKKAEHDLQDHQSALMANALAQAQSLMSGSAVQPGQKAGHQEFPGNRPSSFYVLENLNPAALGALLALQEHRVFVSGVVWGINSFDQWGVELGKTMASDLQQRLHSGQQQGLDASTAGLLAELRS